MSDNQIHLTYLTVSSAHRSVVKKSRLPQVCKKAVKTSQKLYEGYVPMKYKSYTKKMKKLGEWEITLFYKQLQTKGSFKSTLKKALAIFEASTQILLAIGDGWRA
ncbi:uncharacterized protein LOC111390318 [Olea europaea var. sylvestris]|uniref:uncharacterized protein LOC111390318 n=1 Tax=Olea europaea var. sylvestris TaxID=158386 RepID=UPI000C1D6FD5|nr:uncharacterized protein LOC111390318 [Olea europaea var. sylvestris]